MHTDYYMNDNAYEALIAALVAVDEFHAPARAEAFKVILGTVGGVWPEGIADTPVESFAEAAEILRQCRATYHGEIGEMVERFKGNSGPVFGIALHPADKEP